MMKTQTKARIMMVILIMSIVLFISGVILEPFIIRKVATAIAFSGFVGIVTIALMITIQFFIEMWKDGNFE